MKRLRIALAAEESAGVQALRLVPGAGHDLVLVLSSTGGPVSAAAGELGVPTAPAELVADPKLAERLEGEAIDLLLNVHSLHLVDGAVLIAPRIGSFNLHPGPLPQYAGLNAPSWAIYRGERTHAVTLHWMSAEIDAGPIAYAELLEIEPDDTGLSLTVKCARRGMTLVSRLLEEAAVDPSRIPADEQDVSRRRYFEPGPPDGGRVPWAGPARAVIDLVRASDYRPFDSPWGQPFSHLGDRRLELLEASPSGEPAEADPGTVRAGDGPGVMVAAMDEWVIVTRLIVDGEPSEASAVLEPGDRFDPGRPSTEEGCGRIGNGDRG
jgi:methionyl-tRNA formyltransferase